MNLNKLAQAIAGREGGKINLSIAQIKEVLRHAFDILCFYKPSAVLKVLEARRDQIG